MFKPRFCRFTRDLCLLLPLTIFGCARHASDEILVPIAPGIFFPLPNPTLPGPPVTVSQVVTGHQRDTSFTFSTYLRYQSDGVRLVGLDALGRKAITIAWTDTGLRSEAATWLPSVIRAENVIADLVLAYWPLESIRSQADRAGLTVHDTPGNRMIRHGNEDVIRIDYKPAAGESWSRSVHFLNHGLDYQLDIRSMKLPE